MPRPIGFALFVTLVAGCGREEPAAGPLSAAARQPDCSLVLCAQVVCEPGYELATRPNQCCPTCVASQPRVQAGDCACTGGHMDAGYCGQFGAPWSWNRWACFWDARAQGGLSAEECAAVEAKHRGDGSGSDIYNLGLTCLYGAKDCRSRGCPAGEHCDVCRTTDGPAYVCLPDGSVC